MQIDTYYVRIEPRFDIKEFEKVKKKIETLKDSVKIPVKVDFSNSAFNGLKTKIKNSVSKNDIKIKIPVEPILTGQTLKNFKSGFSFKPIQIPAVLKFDTNSLNILRQLWNQAGITPPTTGKKNKGFFDNVLDISKNAAFSTALAPLSAIKTTSKLAVRIGEYGLGGAAIYGAANMTASPFKVEDNLYKIKSLSDYTTTSFDGMNDVIKDIAKGLPIMASELSDAAVAMARANVPAKELFGISGDGKNRYTFNSRTSQLGLVAKLAAYSDEKPIEVANLVKKMKEAFPETDIKTLGDLLAGAADSTQWNFSQMGQFVSSIGPGNIRGMNIDIKDFLGVMSLQSLGWARPSDAGTSFKTFEQFSKNAKSKKSAAAMDFLGLDRWNEKETGLNNFRKYLEDVNNLYLKINKNGGKYTKTYFNSKGKKITETVTLKQVQSMIYEILGSDASRFGSMLNADNIQQTLAGFDRYFDTSSLDQKMSIRGQSALYKMNILFSEIENAFLEAFDENTIRGVGELFRELGVWVLTITQYIKDLGGLSGIWDKFMDSRVMVWLNGVLDVLKIIMRLFNVDIDARLAAMNNATNGSGLMQRFKQNMFNNTINRDSSLQNPVFRTPLKDKLLTDQSKINSENVSNITINQNNYNNQSPLATGLSKAYALTPMGMFKSNVASPWKKLLYSNSKIQADDMSASIAADSAGW